MNDPKTVEECSEMIRKVDRGELPYDLRQHFVCLQHKIADPKGWARTHDTIKGK